MSDLTKWHKDLEGTDALTRIRWAHETFPGKVIATSSFGIQSAVCLHLISQVGAPTPIVFIDTGYLFRETYLYAEQLRGLLNLDIHCYCPAITPAHREALYGRQWEQGPDGLDHYLEACKLEPMNRALEAWKPTVWISGIRRNQSDTRKNRPIIEEWDGLLKLYPIVDWSDAQVTAYLKTQQLPKHPLEADGFVSVGDWHSTTKLRKGMHPQDTRFGGIKRECGLHDRRKWEGLKE